MPELVVGNRELRGQHAKKSAGYETNRDIGDWSLFFLLKPLSTSGVVQNWRSQRPFLLAWLQINEPTFYTKIGRLKKAGFLTIDISFNIHLVSYAKAADIMGIAYAGTYNIAYNPYINAGKQNFRYLIIAEEIKHHQHRQLAALMHKMDNNPPLKKALLSMLIQHGADGRLLLADEHYFQQRLLLLQLQLFKAGSNILSYVFTCRADINRGVKLMKKHHNFKSVQSVTDLKKRLIKLHIITVEKRKAESLERSRIYFPEAGAVREGYKYIKKKKITALFLTDQIGFIHKKQAHVPTVFAKKKAA